MAENYFKQYPDQNGFFNNYGGAFNTTGFRSRNEKITDAYFAISKSHNFISELRSIRKHYQGRPTPVYYCNRYRINMVLALLNVRFEPYRGS
jgi:tryptophan synthase beta chain